MNTNLKFVKFSELNDGDVFLYTNDIYEKFEGIRDEDGEEFNAVCLENGLIESLYCDDKVLKLKGKFVVEEFENEY